jgi:hypothetical protein
MGPFPPGVAWLIRSFHALTIPLWPLVLSHSDDGCRMFALVKGNGQSGREYDRKGVFNKHIDELLSSAKGY